jgi:hypothetical protein
MTRQQGVPTVSWYGHVGFALAAGGLVALTLGRILSARPRGPLTPGRLRALSVIAILIITGCMVSLIFHEWRWFR